MAGRREGAERAREWGMWAHGRALGRKTMKRGRHSNGLPEYLEGYRLKQMTDCSAETCALEAGDEAAAGWEGSPRPPRAHPLTGRPQERQVPEATSSETPLTAALRQAQMLK